MGSSVPAWIPLGLALVGLLLGVGFVFAGLRREARAARRARPESDPDPHLEGLRAALPAGLERRLGRAAFTPETRAGDKPLAGERSHFAGRPWLLRGDDWPACDRCGAPLQLLLELDLDALPAGGPPQRSGGLAQLFYCTAGDCEVEGEAWAPFAPSHRARVVDSSRPGAVAPRDLAPRPLPAARIVGWRARLDLPGRDDWDTAAEPPPAGLLDAILGAGRPLAGDKLGGWPRWIQGPERPRCPECERPMELLFQLDSNDHLAHAFGDAGTGHLTRCPTHSTVLAFGWACA